MLLDHPIASEGVVAVQLASFLVVSTSFPSDSGCNRMSPSVSCIIESSNLNKGQAWQIKLAVLTNPHSDGLSIAAELLALASFV